MAAGMDDFITKPVRLEAVSTVLERWVAESNAGAREDAMSSPPETRDPLDRSQIEFLVSLDDGQGEMLAEIVREYLVSSEECSTELVRLLGEGDREAIERTAHTLKGASANVGASGLADVCAGLEMGAREATAR